MFRRRAPLLLAFAAVTLLLALGASAGAATLAGGSANESFQAWFVQFKTPPAAKGGSKSALAAERTAFFKNAADQGVSVTQRRSFDDLWNGVSVNVPKAQAGALATISGVQAVYPVLPVYLPPSTEGGTSDPDLKYATGMTGATFANESGYTGKGVKVAIMDSGLDYTLPEFGSCSSIGGSCRVAGGYDFVGDDYDASSANSTYQPTPHPDDDPAPCDPNVADQRATQPGAGSSAAAHGTHVAGIVGADGRNDPDNLVTGVAPEATLYAYRVFGCNGSTDSDIMAAAMERSFEDHVQVLNMSIGSALANFPNYPTAVAADNLADRGVVVVASIGNSGETGLYSAGAPGVGEKVIGVASVDNIKTYLQYFTVSADNRHVGYTDAAAAPGAPTTGLLTLAQTGTPTTTNDACPTPPAIFKDLGSGYEGKAVLIRRGSCGFYNKALAAQHAGAAAVILYNNVAGRINPTVAPVAPGTETIHIPVVAITAADGSELSSRITAGNTTLTWTDQSEYFDNSGQFDTGGRTSSFSSWGTSSDLGFKPDITAPGGNIRSTWPHQQHGGHWVISGTSMSSPHVAGAVALYLQAHPGTSPSDVRTALQNSADPVAFTSNPVADSTARQGAGLLDIPGAIFAESVITPGKIAFGQVTDAAANATITIRNNGTAAQTYTLSSIGAVTPRPSATTNYPYTFGLIVGPPATFPNGSSVTVQPGTTATVPVSVNIAGMSTGALFGGWVFATSSTGTVSVPFLGFAGNYQSLPVITNAGCGLPSLARFGSNTDAFQCGTATPVQGILAQPSGGVWDRPKQDPIIVLYHFQHQSANYSLTLLNATTDQPVTEGGRIPIVESVDLIPRNSGANTFFASVWDGTLAFTTGNGKVQRKAAPGGVYKLKLTITKVKAFNDPGAAGTESWTSPAFTLRDG
jgi:minor extracellular serine protease Vpr